MTEETAVMWQEPKAKPKAAPKKIERNGKHQYRFFGDVWVPGVTGILKVQEALDGTDGLMRWGVNIAAKVAFDHGRMPESPDFQAALEAAVEAVDEARNRGTRVHAGIEAAILDEDHIPTPQDGAIWYQWSRFLLKEKPEIIATEQYVLKPGQYGGTFDLDAMVRGKRALIDVKTGKFKATFPLQLAGYVDCQWKAPSPAGTPAVAMKRTDYEAFYVLMLSDQGYELKPLEVGDAEIAHFQFLAKTYQTLKTWAQEAA